MSIQIIEGQATVRRSVTGRKSASAACDEKRRGKRRKKRTSSLVCINPPSTVLPHRPPNTDSDRARERKQHARVGVQHEPHEALREWRPRRDQDAVDVDVRAADVASEPGREDHAEERDGLVRAGEDPSLELATRGGEAGGPGPNEVVEGGGGEHDEAGLEEDVEGVEVRREDHEL